jgi:hypothetical protein
MSSLIDQLAEIEKKITVADRRVEQQLGLIEELIHDAHDAQPALDLLGQLERSLSTLRERRDQIETMIRREESS